MVSANDLLKKVEQLKELLVNRATGNSLPEDAEVYSVLRREILGFSEVQQHIPDFVKTHRTLGEFWQYIKARFGTYQERREYLREEFGDVLFALESNIQSQHHKESASVRGAESVFQSQFPAGLPFGIKKPSIAVVPYLGQQRVSFEDEEEIGVIRDNVYPNFSYSQLGEQLRGKPILFKHNDPFVALFSSIQTPNEIALFTQYIEFFDMLKADVPTLIPQAWIQWHSKTKQDLRSLSSKYTDDLYRVDFVAFWNNKRYAILIDDISHYAKKLNSEWKADQEAYSKRLKEDRKLRKEGWIVFRASNWEIRTADFTREILKDLQETIGF